jgi:hypothetical protein
MTYRLLGRQGRLGNQLWQIASTIGIAASQGVRAGFPYWRYADYFSVPATYFPDLASVEGDDLGPRYLQSVANFASVEPLIRSIFAPSAGTRARLAHRHHRLLSLPHKTAVHVRRGDYADHPELYVQLDEDYYHRAMERADPPYLIFSDDPAWCRPRFPDDCLIVEHNRDYEDLFLMASCDTVITANSSFSWWGAWLSTGRRIYPRRWHTDYFARDPRLGQVQEHLMRPLGAELVDN